jgi:hypothetical protein
MTHPSCSHPVADPVAFSKLFANRRDHPDRPSATSTRHALGHTL